MIFQLLRRNPPARIVDALYGVIVAQARRQSLYDAYGVPDTVEGRFDLIVLHVVLLFRRLREEEGRKLAQAVFDRFCRDMDHNLREMGISDQGIPRQMRVVGEAYFGRAASYDTALAAADNEALVSLVRRTVFGDDPDAAGAVRLAAYVRAAAGDLDAQDSAAIARGVLHFPDPITIFAGESSTVGP